MSLTRIENLTPAQETLIPQYREKWRKIAISTERIDRQKAAEAIDAAYAAIGLYKPRLIFYDSPYEGLGKLDSRLQNLSKKGVKTLLHKQLMQQCGLLTRGNPLIRQLWLVLERQIENQVGGELYRLLGRELSGKVGENLFQIERQLYNKMESQLYSQDYLKDVKRINQSDANIYEELTPLEELLKVSIKPETLTGRICLYDFCISVLNCTCDRSKWEAVQLLVKDCGWFAPFESIAIVCDRPIKLSFDSQNLLHAEGEPAIEFADGYSLYCYRGVTLPEKYGKLHPHQWQSQWILEENNAELRRVLVQGIGYARIYQELQAKELDSFREYTLFKIDIAFDVEPIYLLKMTCPSTGFIHTLRVPPDMESAREAICWVNWEVDPEEFAVQT